MIMMCIYIFYTAVHLDLSSKEDVRSKEVAVCYS